MKAKDIMNDKFLVFDAEVPLKTCLKNFKNGGFCVVLKNGIINKVLCEDDILKYIVKGKDILLGSIKSNSKFCIVDPETDVEKVIELLKDFDIIIVKDGNYFGIITKKEISEINQLIFDEIEEKSEIVY